MRAIYVPIILFACFFALPVFAQLDTTLTGQSNAFLAVEPDFPAPNQLAEVSIENFGSQLSSSDITWFLNGEVLADATNKRSAEFVVGELEDDTTVTAQIVTQSGATEELTVVVEPKYIDIVFEPQTRVPDFYAGRALPSFGSQVNAAVLINDGSMVTGDYIYTWLVNNRALPEGPIRGTNQVVFDVPRGAQITVQVEVSTLTGQVIGRRGVFFESVRPELLFYESNALYGQSHLAITEGLVLIGQSATVIAEPYNLDIRYYNDPDIIEWEINRTLQPENVVNPYRITVQKLSDGGDAEVSFHVRSTTQLLQGAEDEFNIIF